MLPTVFYGSMLIAWSPLAVMIVAVLAFHPTLAMITMASAFVALLPVQFTSFVYLTAIAVGDPDADVASFSSDVVRHADAGRWAMVLLGVAFQELTRALLCYALVRAEWYFRGHHQVLFASRFRLLPVGAAVGVGMALTLSVLPMGAVLASSIALDDAAVFSRDGEATMYNMDACPQLPYLAFMALSWCFMTVAQVAWSVVTIASVAALIGRIDEPEVTTSPIPRLARRPIPLPTTLLMTSDGVCGLAYVVALHALASGISLVNTDAFDWASAEPNARGCIVSLPTQAVVMLLSCLSCVGLTKIEAVKRIDPEDL